MTAACKNLGIVGMKVVGIISLLTMLCFNDSFSQINNHARDLDRALQSAPLSNYLDPSAHFDSDISPDSPLVHPWKYESPLFFGKDVNLLTDVAGHNGQDYYQSVEKMPCLKPDGLFRMEILKPDTTVQHTMLVK
jgi:hypothetical protein